MHGLGRRLAQRAVSSAAPPGGQASPQGFRAGPSCTAALASLAGGTAAVDQDHQQSLRGRGPWTGRIGRLPLGGSRASSAAPFGHLGLEGGLTGGTSGRNSALVSLAKASPSGGRSWGSANRKVPRTVASCQRRSRIPQIGINTNIGRHDRCVHLSVRHARAF